MPPAPPQAPAITTKMVNAIKLNQLPNDDIFFILQRMLLTDGYKHLLVR